MNSHDQRPGAPEFEVDDEMDVLLGRGFPNPAREGCPPVDVVRELARKGRPITDAGYEHLAQCSPCYREFRGFQQANRSAHAGARARQRWVLAAAAAVIVAIAGSWLVLKRDGPREVTSSRGVVNVQATRLDLRPFAVTRGGEPRPTPDPLVLPRGHVRATILLPVGAEPGPYELRILDEALSVRAAATGEATIRDYVTTIVADVDIAALPPSAYQLGVRRAGGEWQFFPAVVRQ